MSDGEAVHVLGDVRIRSFNEKNFHTVHAWKPSAAEKRAAQTLPGNFRDLKLTSATVDRKRTVDFLKSTLRFEREAVLAELSQRHDLLIQAISSNSLDNPLMAPSPLPPTSPASLPGIPMTVPIEEPEAGDAEEDVEKKTTGTGMTALDVRSAKRSHLFRPAWNPEGLPWWHPSAIVNHPSFDAFFCGIILINVFVMSLDLQYNGLKMGNEIAFGNYAKPADEAWPGAKDAFDLLEYIFGGIFTAEIILKIIGQRLSFPFYIWNWIDTTIVAFWAVDTAFTNVTVPVPAPVIRLVRMARLLRLVRLVRTIQGFDSLYIMTTAIKGSFQILVWTFVLLLLVQTTIAFLLNQILASFIQDETLPLEQRHKLFEYFGTTTRALLSMFELALGNWPVIARILQENVTEYFTVFSIAFKLVVGFAVIGVVNGIFMQETFNVAANDDRIMLQKKQRDQAKHIEKMRTFFKAADSSGDGVLDLEEFSGILDNVEIKQWLAAQGLSVNDATNLFQLIDDGDGELSADEVVKGVERLKGAARSIDLAMYMRQYDKFSAEVSRKLGIDQSSLKD